jgi:DMSO/TMAO reductase YedYZ heme-binding membrane subunit
MVWIGSVLLSALVMLVTYLAPAAEIAVTSDSPPGFLLLWTRYSAHLAFVFLLLAFSASTLKAFANNAQTRGLVRYRRQLGLGFATAHTFHLVALILFLSNLEGYSVDASVSVAGFGYVVTALLAVTSNDYSIKRLGPAKWKQLHSVGISILMLYFFVAFSGRLLANFAPIYAVYVALIATAVVAKLRVKRRTMAAATD